MISETATAVRRKLVDDVLIGSPVATNLGIRLLRVDADCVQLRLPFKPSNVTAEEVVHGGVLATLADVAGVTAAVMASRETPTGGATSSLSISFLAPAQGSDLVARARTLRVGRTQTVCAVSICTEEGAHVAEALLTVTLFTSRS